MCTEPAFWIVELISCEIFLGRDDLRVVPKLGTGQSPSLPSLHPRPSPAGVAGILYRPSFWFYLCDAGAVFYFHDLIPQKRGTLEFQIGGSALHIIFKFTQKFGHVEIAADFTNDRRLDLAAAQNGMQTLLHRPSNSLRCNAMFLVVIDLLRAPVFRYRHERFHALRDLIGKEYHLAIDMPRSASGRLNQRGLTAEKAFLVRIQDANE